MTKVTGHTDTDIDLVLASILLEVLSNTYLISLTPLFPFKNTYQEWDPEDYLISNTYYRGDGTYP